MLCEYFHTFRTWLAKKKVKQKQTESDSEVLRIFFFKNFCEICSNFNKKDNNLIKKLHSEFNFFLQFLCNFSKEAHSGITKMI